MSDIRASPNRPRDPAIQNPLDELQLMISRHFSAAEFFVTMGEDPEGVHLHAMVDIEDLDDVTEVVVSRLVDIQVDEGLPVYVFPQRPVDGHRGAARGNAA